MKTAVYPKQLDGVGPVDKRRKNLTPAAAAAAAV